MQGIKKATPIKARREEIEDSDDDASKIFGGPVNDEEQSQGSNIDSATAMDTNLSSTEELPNTYPKMIKLHSDSEALSNRGAVPLKIKPRSSEGNFSDDDEEQKMPFQAPIPIAKTNMKEGRKRTPSTKTFLADIVNKPQSSEETKSLEKYRENELFILQANRPRAALNMKQANKQSGIKNDPYKVSNAIVMEINNMAGQLFELTNLLFKLIIFKPKKIYKLLSDGYQRRLEERYGENILRHVIRTSDFSFPSEDYTGQLNEIVARKTREMFALHAEMVGRESMDIEEVKIIEDLLQNGKKRRKKRNLEKYAPLIFEECYMKQKSTGHS